jgi:hypothetical protein
LTGQLESKLESFWEEKSQKPPSGREALKEQERLKHEALKQEYLALLAFENDLKKKQIQRKNSRSPKEVDLPRTVVELANESFGTNVNLRAPGRSPIVYKMHSERPSKEA